ncbi:MAG TPA: chloride channel protein [Phycisphaeraceae bacterium]
MIRWHVRINRVLSAAGLPRDFFLIPLAGVIGALGGLVATGFDWLVESSGHLFYGTAAQRSWLLSVYAPLIVLPALGGLAVGVIQKWIARSGPSHGIPEVIESLARDEGRMPARSGFYKALTASLTIGSGGSAGMEGPIIQIGSVLGSVVGTWLRVGREHMHTLVGCGAAAGLAGIFNAPIAGVLLVLEVILRDFSIKTFIPIVVASVFGTAVAQAVMGHNAAVFSLPESVQVYQVDLTQLWAYALLGVLAGLVGAAFSWGMHASERMFSRWGVPAFCRPAVGGAMLGVLGVAFWLLWGSNWVPGYEPPPFYGNGYPVIEALLNPRSYEAGAAPAEAVADAGANAESGASAAPLVDQAGHSSKAVPLARVTLAAVAVTLAFKLIGTCLTLGSGGSGGIFAPSLFMGAALGGTFGLALQMMGLLPGGTPAIYALAGMAGVIAAAVHAPLTAFLLVFEITRDYQVILPVMLVAILAATASRMLSRESIYGRWLLQRGIRMGTYADMTLLRRLAVSQVPLVPAVAIDPAEPAQRLIELAQTHPAADYVVCDKQGCYLGLVVGEDLRTALVQPEAMPLMIVDELMRTDLPTVRRSETLDLVLDKFSRHDVSSLAVVDERRQVQGLITRGRLMRQYHRALEEF